MAPLAPLGEDNWDTMWHVSFHHVMLMVPVWASHGTDGIVNGTILFVRSRWLTQGETWLLCHVMPVLPSNDADGIMNSTIAFLTSRCSKWSATLALIFTSHDVNGTIAFLRSRQLKWGATWHFGIWCHWHWHQCHTMPTALSVRPLHTLG